MHTIKPLDEKRVLSSVSKTSCAVIAEEHQLFGGLGESIASLCAASRPVPMEFVAVRDVFGQSGTPEELMVKYRLDTPDIVSAALKVITRKQ
ncbi:MAG: 1-deoxy-D-xylulose-5-phosphate synthase [Bacteroidetes bacterium ADurb.Bin408]|nr:MAG: 1-deoxy-D-xylulose-5-phosphate synthase [Bacteroidetes bacterium ADurb.Bin408]